MAEAMNDFDGPVPLAMVVDMVALNGCDLMISRGK